MSIEHYKVAGPQNAEIMTTTVEAHEEMAPQNVTATMAITSKGHKNMAPENAVADKMKAVETKESHTSDTAEPASEIKDTKQKADYKRKKKDKQGEESREKIKPREKEKKQKEIDKKIQTMNKALLKQGNVGSKETGKSWFRKTLDKKSESIWNKLTGKQQTSIIGYTAIKQWAKGHPYFTTMNNILRKGMYEEGGGVDAILEHDNPDDHDYEVVEISKQNFDAVTDCRNALKKSKLHKDMVFRRGTNVETLLAMLGLKPQEYGADLSAPVRKNINKYNEGNEIVFDRGFLSTTPFVDAGFVANQPDKVEWIIQGHAGDQALFVANHSRFENEGEMLFQAGTIFRLLRICPPGTEENQVGWKVYMETVHTDIGTAKEKKSN